LPDLHFAAACDADPGIVHVYRMDDGAERLTIDRGNDYVGAKAFSHDSRSLAVGDFRGTVTLWDLTSRQPRACASGPGMVSALAFSPDGASLAVGHGNEYRWFRQTPIRLVDPITLDEQAVLGESNYRPHVAVLLAGFVIWLVCWRWVRGRRWLR
jgi:WD40 repeat protein